MFPLPRSLRLARQLGLAAALAASARCGDQIEAVASNMLAAVAALPPGRGDGMPMGETTVGGAEAAAEGTAESAVEGAAAGVAEGGRGGGETPRGGIAWCTDAKGSVCGTRPARPVQLHNGALLTVEALAVSLDACCRKAGGGARLLAKSWTFR